MKNPKLIPEEVQGKITEARNNRTQYASTYEAHYYKTKLVGQRGKKATERITQLCLLHAAIQCFIDCEVIIKNGELRITKKLLHETLSEKSFREAKLPSYKTFINTTLPACKAKGIFEHLTSKIGIANAQKCKQEHIDLIKHLYLTIELSTAPWIHRNLETHLERLGLCDISLSLVKAIINRNKHDWDRLKYPELNKNHNVKGVGVKPQNPLTMWMIDGSKLSFPYLKREESGELSIGLAHFFIVIDVYSNKIVGWSMDESEEHQMILKAIRMACEFVGKEGETWLPGEIKSDNASAFHHDVFLEFKRLAQNYGDVVISKHAPHNPTGKAEAEKAVNGVQSIMNMHPNVIGLGVKTKKRNSRKSDESIREIQKVKNLASFNEVLRVFGDAVNEFNRTLYDGKRSANDVFNSNDKWPYATRLELSQKRNLFLHTTPATIGPSGQFHIKVRGDKYHYLVDRETWTEYVKNNPGKGLGVGSHEVYVKFDPKEMHTVVCYDRKNSTRKLFEVCEQPKHRKAAKERTEEDTRITSAEFEINHKEKRRLKELKTKHINNPAPIILSYLDGKEKLKEYEDEKMRRLYAEEYYAKDEETISPKQAVAGGNEDTIVRQDKIKTPLRVLK